PPASRSPIHTVPTSSTLPTAPTTPAGGAATVDSQPDDHGADATVPTTPALPGDGGSTPTSTPDAGPSPTQPAPTDHPCSSAGGSIAVHFEKGQVALVSSSPAPGYTASTQDNGPTRVEVRFSAGSTEWRIRVDVDNGQLVPDISSHG